MDNLKSGGSAIAEKNASQESMKNVINQLGIFSHRRIRFLHFFSAAESSLNLSDTNLLKSMN